MGNDSRITGEWAHLGDKILSMDEDEFLEQPTIQFEGEVEALKNWLASGNAENGRQRMFEMTQETRAESFQKSFSEHDLERDWVAPLTPKSGIIDRERYRRQ
jgi:hypothetical protein